MPPDFTSPDNFTLLVDQFTKSMHAVISLTQSLQNIQAEVSTHATNLSSLSNEVSALNYKTDTLINLVQGQGMGDSIYKTLVQLGGRVDHLEATNVEEKEALRVHRPLRRLGWITVVAATITSIVTALLTTFVPMLLKKGGP